MTANPSKPGQLGIFAIALSSCFSSITPPEAVTQIEQVFIDNRATLVELADTAIKEMEQSGTSDWKLPPANFYDSAWIAVSLNGKAFVANFVIDDFYLPLVYVSTNEPADAYDTCANGGRVVKTLEPHWYICQRDRN